MSANLQKDWWRPASSNGPRMQTDSVAGTNDERDGSTVPFVALVALTFIILISPQAFLPVLAPLRIALLTAALAVMSYLFDRFMHRRPLLVFTREIWIAVLLFGWAVITLPLSYWPGGSIDSLTGIYAKTMIVFILLTQVVTSLRRLRIIIWSLSLMAVPISLIALFNMLTGSYMDGAAASGPDRIIGYNAPLTENPNDLALTLNLILPLSVALFLSGGKPIVRAMLLAFICLNIIAIIATFSRGGFLTLAATSVLYTFTIFKRGQRRWIFLAMFIVLAALPLLPAGYVDRMSTITDIESDETGSSQARWRDMLAAGVFVLHNPVVGAGLGMDALALNEVRGPLWTVIHNVYLQYAIDLGLPGLILFVMLLTGCLKCVRNTRETALAEKNMPAISLFADGIRISLIAFAVAAMFHPVGYHFYFYYIAGLAIALRMIRISRATLAAVDETQTGRRFRSIHEQR